MARAEADTAARPRSFRDMVAEVDDTYAGHALEK